MLTHTRTHHCLQKHSPRMIDDAHRRIIARPSLVRYNRNFFSLSSATPSLVSLGSCSRGTLHPPPTKARVQTAKQASSLAAAILLLVLMLLSTASVTGAEKLRPWRPVGFNPVLDVSPGAREYGRMVSFRDMVFLWGGKNPATASGECALSVDSEAGCFCRTLVVCNDK